MDHRIGPFFKIWMQGFMDRRIGPFFFKFGCRNSWTAESVRFSNRDTGIHGPQNRSVFSNWKAGIHEQLNRSVILKFEYRDPWTARLVRLLKLRYKDQRTAMARKPYDLYLSRIVMEFQNSFFKYKLWGFSSFSIFRE